MDAVKLDALDQFLTEIALDKTFFFISVNKPLYYTFSGLSSFHVS